MSYQPFTEPRICYDDNCSFPFGPACAECSSAFDYHQMRTEAVDPDRRESKEALVKAVSFSPGPHHSKGLKPSPSDTSGTHSEGISTRHTEQGLTSLSSGQTISGKDLVSTNSSQPEGEARLRLSRQTNRSTSSLCSLSSFENNQLAESLDPWLSELFSNTLEGQLRSTHFIGGAEDENTTLDFCPICHAPLGDPRDQHLLRCQYAHEEQARMEDFISQCERRPRR